MRQPIPLLALLLTSLTSVSAGPLPRNAAHDYNGAGYLLPRNCASGWCGYAQDFCCDGGQVCVTDAQDIAKCGPATALAAVDGGWAFYTTTYIETVEAPITKVETLSSFIGNVAVPSQYIPQSTAWCLADEISCGAICCKGGKFCHTNGDCRDTNGHSGTFEASYLTPIVPATSFSAPVRPTSLTVTTVPITTTQPFLAPVQTTGGAITPLVPVAAEGGGLSPGAIAGIVVGTIAAIIILLLLLACCLLGTGIKGLLGLFSGKKKTRPRSTSPRGHRTEIYEERRTTQRVGGAAAGARYSGEGRWVGGRSAAAAPVGRRTTVTQVTEKRRTGVGKEAAVAGLGLGALWAGLRWKRKREVEKRRPGSSYYERSSYSGYTGSTTDSKYTI